MLLIFWFLKIEFQRNQTECYNNMAFISPTFAARKEPFAAVAFINKNKLDGWISRREPNTSRTNEKKTHFWCEIKRMPGRLLHGTANVKAKQFPISISSGWMLTLRAVISNSAISYCYPHFRWYFFAWAIPFERLRGILFSTLLNIVLYFILVYLAYWITPADDKSKPPHRIHCAVVTYFA